MAVNIFAIRGTKETYPFLNTLVDDWLTLVSVRRLPFSVEVAKSAASPDVVAVRDGRIIRCHVSGISVSAWLMHFGRIPDYLVSVSPEEVILYELSIPKEKISEMGNLPAIKGRRRRWNVS